MKTTMAVFCSLVVLCSTPLYSKISDPGQEGFWVPLNILKCDKLVYTLWEQTDRRGVRRISYIVLDRQLILKAVFRYEDYKVLPGYYELMQEGIRFYEVDFANYLKRVVKVIVGDYGGPSFSRMQECYRQN